MPVHDSDYCTIQRVTENVKVTKATVHNWAKTGRIRKYKIGGRTLFKVSELENLITYGTANNC